MSMEKKHLAQGNFLNGKDQLWYSWDCFFRFFEVRLTWKFYFSDLYQLWLTNRPNRSIRTYINIYSLYIGLSSFLLLDPLEMIILLNVAFENFIFRNWLYQVTLISECMVDSD